MAARNSLVEDIRELFEASELDELVKFNPKAPAGVKRSPQELRKGQADMIKAMRSRLRKGTSKDPEADKFRLGQALKDAGAKKAAAKLGHGEHPDKKEPPKHKEPEHQKHARDAEAASADAHDSHERHKDDADSAFTAMHAHMTAIKAHQKALEKAKATHSHASMQHHSKMIQKHAKMGKEAQSWHRVHSKDDDKKKAANESLDFDQFLFGMTEQRRLMGFDDTPTREGVAVGGSLQEMNKILFTNTEHQRLLMGYDNPYPTLKESREPVEEDEQEEAVRLSTSDDPEHRSKIAKAAKVLKKVKGANVAAFFNRK